MPAGASSVVGCVAESELVRVVELRGRGHVWEVIRAESMLALDSGMPGPAKRGDVVTCLAPCEVQYRHLRLGRIPKEELETAVFWRAVREIDCDCESVRTDFYEVADGTDGTQRPEVVVVAATHEAIGARIKAVRRFGLSPTVLDTTVGALARCVPASHRAGDAAWLLVELDRGQSTIAVVRSGRPCFIHPVTIGGVENAASIAAELLPEINLALHHLGERGHELPRAAFLVGEPSIQSKLVEMLDRGSDLRFHGLAEAIDGPWKTIVERTGAPADAWLVPYGLALRGCERRADDTSRRFNMMPPAKRWRAPTRPTGSEVVVAGTAALVVWVVAAGVQIHRADARLADLSAEVRMLQAEAQVRQGLTLEHDELAASLNRLTSLRDPVQPAGLLATLADMIPAEAVLKALTVEVEPAGRDRRDRRTPPIVRVRLDGVASDNSAIADIIGRMHASSRFRDVRLDESRELVNGSESRYVFTISMEVVPDGAPNAAEVES